MIKLYALGTEVTNSLDDALNTPITVNLIAGTNILEVRSDKKLKQIYWDVTSTHDGTLSMEYWNGSAFTALTIQNDATNALKKSGYVVWTQPTDDAKDSGFYKYRFNINAVSGAFVQTIRHVGIIFAQDFDLKEDYPNILDHLPTNDTSMIRFHVSAKKDIIQYFRQKGYKVYDTEPKDLDEFDFLDPTQLKQAGKFLALSKIFFWLSDSTEDKWYQKFQDYRSRGYDAVDVFYITLDTNNNGVEDEGEKLQENFLLINRA